MGRLWKLGILLLVFGFSANSYGSAIKITEKIYTSAKPKGHFLTYKEIRHLDKKKRSAYLKKFEKFLAKYDSIKKHQKKHQRKSKKFSFVDYLINQAQANRLTVGPCLNKGILFEPLDGSACTDSDTRTEGMYTQLNTLCQAGETHCSILLGVGNCTSKNSTRACMQRNGRNKQIVQQAFDRCAVNAQGTAEAPSAVAMTIPNTNFTINCNDFVNEINDQVRLADLYISRGKRSDVSKNWVRNMTAPFRRAAISTIASTCEYKDRRQTSLGTQQSTGTPNCDRARELSNQQIQWRAEYEQAKAEHDGEGTVGAPRRMIHLGHFSRADHYNGLWDRILRNIKSCSESGRNCQVLEGQLSEQRRLNNQYWQDRSEAQEARQEYFRRNGDYKGAPSGGVSYPDGLILYMPSPADWSAGDRFAEIKRVGLACATERRQGRQVAASQSNNVCIAHIENCEVGGAIQSGWYACPQVNNRCPSDPRVCISDRTIAVQGDMQSAARAAVTRARSQQQ